jgi:hypothetical protein
LDSNYGLPALYNKELYEMEMYLLGFILNWRLIYNTPFDFIQSLANKMSEENGEFKNNADGIAKKAIQISELLLICNFTLNSIAYNTINNYSIFSIALVSLCGAIQVLNKESLLYCVDKFINKENKVKHSKRLGGS